MPPPESADKVFTWRWTVRTLIGLGSAAVVLGGMVWTEAQGRAEFKAALIAEVAAREHAMKAIAAETIIRDQRMADMRDDLREIRDMLFKAAQDRRR